MCIPSPKKGHQGHYIMTLKPSHPWNHPRCVMGAPVAPLYLRLGGGTRTPDPENLMVTVLFARGFITHVSEIELPKVFLFGEMVMLVKVYFHCAKAKFGGTILYFFNKNCCSNRGNVDNIQMSQNPTKMSSNSSVSLQSNLKYIRNLYLNMKMYPWQPFRFRFIFRLVEMCHYCFLFFVSIFIMLI